MVQTQRFDLYQPPPSEEVNVDLHLNANWDKIDLAAKKAELDNQLNVLRGEINALQNMVFGGGNRTQMPACKIQMSGTRNVPSNDTTEINFGEKVWESEGSMSDLANNHVIPPVGGAYLAVLQYTFEGLLNNYMRGQIRVNNAVRASHKTVGAGAGTGSGDSPGIVTYIGKLSAGDHVSGWVWHNDPALQKITGNAPGTNLSLIYIGKVL